MFTIIRLVTVSILLVLPLHATLLDEGTAQAQKGNMSEALKLWEKACSKNSFSACQNAARVYDSGNGVTQDDKKALFFYTKACDVGYGYSCAKLGLIYAEGTAITQDKKKAFKLYTKACGAKDMFACHKVAVHYGKEKSKERKEISYKFYNLACHGGYDESCIFLGRLYRDSRVVPADYKKAKAYFSLACDKNNRLGCKEVRILEGAGY